ncbi:MAG: dolichyl-phosphate beta-glucosyltransferase [Kiritimatiellales bacterium]
MKLSIVIPAHNEEQRLPPMLEAYGQYFSEKYPGDAELIVVSNFSSDRTADIAREFAVRFPVIRVIDEKERIGKGGAVMLGSRAAVGEFIGFVDADGATPPAAFDDLVNHIESCDCVIASRWMKGSVVSPQQPLSRRFASRCFNFTVRILFGLKLHDTQCGAKLFRREIIFLTIDQLGVTSWAFDVDMLFQAKRAGARICEIPTEWHDIAGSKIRVVHSSIEMLLALGRLRLFYSPFRFIIPPLSKALSFVYPHHLR